MLKLTASSELMTNHKHVDVKTSNSQMQVAQTSDGLAVLFSIDESGKLVALIEENSNEVGWRKEDLMTQFFQHQNINSFTCKMFLVCQSPDNVYIDIIAVVVINGKEFLYYNYGIFYGELQLIGNTTNWTALNQDHIPKESTDMVYTKLVFNYEKVPNHEYRIKNRYLMIEFLTVPDQPNGGVTQCLIRNDDNDFVITTKILLNSSDSINSVVLGKRTNDAYFGIFAIQKGDDATNKLMYLRHADQIPSMQILTTGTPTYTATTLNDDNTTRLYVSLNNTSQGKGGIAVYDSNQMSNTVNGNFTIIANNSVLIIESALLQDVAQLVANASKTESIIWGVTKSGDIFRMKCPKGSESTPSAWSAPVAIVKGASKIAPYLNFMTVKSVIFVQNQDGTLIKIKQDPATKIWQQRNVLVQPSSIQNIREYDTFTTHVQVVDENGYPHPESIHITMTTDSRASFYINNKYQVLTNGLNNELYTDDLGTLTIVQETHSLSAAKFKLTLSDNNSSIDVNPMQNIFIKLNSINTWDDLNQTIFDEYNVESKLINGTFTEPAKDGILNSIKNLQTSLGKITNPTRTTRDLPTAWGLSFTGNDFVYSTGDAALGAIFGINPRTRTPNQPNTIQIIAEDLFKFLKHSPNEVKTVGYYETALLISFADAVYSVALDTEHAIAHTFHLILQRLQVEWQKIKQYAGYIFNWKDIMATHGVLRKIYDVYSQHSLETISSLKTTIDTQITQAKNNITGWVNNVNLKNMNDTAGSSVNNKSPKGIHQPQAHYGMHHFKNHSSYIGATKDIPITQPNDSLLASIKTIVDTDLANLTDIKNKMYDQVISVFSTSTLTQIIDNIVEIIKVETLEIVRRVLLGILDKIYTYLNETLQSLNKEIDFPILAFIYEKYTGNTFTIADVVCLVCAIPVTVVYKLEHNDAPFPSGGILTNNILNVNSFGDFNNIINSQNGNTRNDTTLVKDILTATGGVAAFISSLVLVYYNSQTNGNVLKGYLPIDDEYSKRISKYAAVANVFYVSPNLPGFLDSKWYQILNTGLTFTSIAKGFISIKFNSGKGKLAMDWAEMVMNVLWFAPVIWNAIDEKNDPAYHGLIPETIADSAFNVGGIITPWVPVLQATDTPQGLLAAKGLYYLQNTSMIVYGFGITVSGFMKLSKS